MRRQIQLTSEKEEKINQIFDHYAIFMDIKEKLQDYFNKYIKTNSCFCFYNQDQFFIHNIIKLVLEINIKQKQIFLDHLNLLGFEILDCVDDYRDSKQTWGFTIITTQHKDPLQLKILLGFAS